MRYPIWWMNEEMKRKAAAVYGNGDLFFLFGVLKIGRWSFRDGEIGAARESFSMIAAFSHFRLHSTHTNRLEGG